MTTPSPSDPGLSHDELLAACLRAPHEDQARLLDEACERHPDLAQELREEFEVLSALGLAGLAAEQVEGGETPGGEGPRFGDFELLEVLAEGGMGVVHRARQISLDREVVVKLIRPELMHFQTTRARFAREAEAVAQLEHRGIVRIHAFGEENGVPYIAMERLDGTSLDDLIQDRSAAAPDRAWIRSSLELCAQVADALHHAHARGILHRDVKPANVIVDSGGRATLIDFGLHAHDEDDGRLQRLTREGSAPGTLLYMAPEQLEDGSFDVRSEVYSLGATLFELLTGEPPFRGPSRSATEQLIRRGSVPALRKRCPSIPADVDAVVRKALSVDPTRRYVDSASFARDLRNALERRPVAARPDGALYRIGCWARRQPALAAVSGLAAILAVAAPLTVILQQQRSARSLQATLNEEREARLAAEDMSDFVIDVLESADPNENKPTAAVQQILSRGVERLDERLGRYPERRAEAQRVLGRIHGSLGLFEASLDLLDASVAALETRLSEMRRDHGGEEERVRFALSRLVEARSARAKVIEVSGDYDEAFAERKVLAEEMSVLWPEGHWRRLHARANWMRLADRASEEALAPDGRPGEEETLEVMRRASAAVLAAQDITDDWKASTLGWQGGFLVRTAQTKRGDEARALFDEAQLTLQASLDYFDGSSVEGSIDHADAHSAHGVALKFLGELDRCEEAYRKSLAILEERLAPDSLRIGAACVNMAGLIEARGKPEEAIELLARSYEIFLSQLDEEHPYAVQVAGNLAGTRFRAGDHEGLIDVYDRVIELQSDVFGERHGFLAASHENRGVLRKNAGDAEGGRRDMEEALERFQEFLPDDAAPVVRLRQALEAL